MMWVCKIAYDDNGLGLIPSQCYRHPVLVDEQCLPTIRKLDSSATNMLLLTACTPRDDDERWWW